MIEFVERTRGYSGWPLNVFITPEGYPLVGIVYLPPGDFMSLITDLRGRWHKDPQALASLARQAAADLRPAPGAAGAPPKAGVGKAYEAALVERALALADDTAGGFGNQSKFPSVPQLRALLRAYERAPREQLGNFLRLTLDQMADKGLHDLLAGGFFRYTVDPNWDTPHFEKMLYDNALLADLYLTAGRVLGAPSYRQVGRETLDFMIRELAADSGALAASLSSVDDQGVEGGYYLWDEAQLRDLLTGDEYRAAAEAWGMEGPAPTEAGYLPLRLLNADEVAARLGVERAQIRARLDSARTKLLRARAARVVPKDPKGLAAWNGLALTALVHGASLEDGGETYRDAAQRVRDYLVGTLWNGERMARAGGAAAAVGNAVLEDYAHVATGLLAWAQFSRRAEDLAIVRQIVEQAWRRFRVDGAWQVSEDILIPYLGREAALADDVLPAPSAVLLEVSLRLADMLKDESLKARALSALGGGGELLAADPFWFATQIAVIADYQAAR